MAWTLALAVLGLFLGLLGSPARADDPDYNGQYWRFWSPDYLSQSYPTSNDDPAYGMVGVASDGDWTPVIDSSSSNGYSGGECALHQNAHSADF